jgi:hypothetical protein
MKEHYEANREEINVLNREHQRLVPDRIHGAEHPSIVQKEIKRVIEDSRFRIGMYIARKGSTRH